MDVDELRTRLTCTVPEAGRALGIGRDSAYRAAAAGELPTLTLGRRLVVPVPKLLELLGLPQAFSDGAAATTAPNATTTDDLRGVTHDDHLARG
jgi:hypothetical protein